MEQNEQLAVQPAKTNMAVSNKGIVITSFDELWRFSNAVSKSGLTPKGMETPESIMIALQMGMEIGLSPMKSLQSIAVINGKPTIYGDAAKAMVLASSVCEYINESYSGDGETLTAICKSKRVGSDEHVTTFSVADAKKANLWNKNSVWSSYGKRMLMMRARGFSLRDVFADVLGGYQTYEEVNDYAPITNGPSNEVKVDKVHNSIKEAVKKIATTATKQNHTAPVTKEEAYTPVEVTMEAVNNKSLLPNTEFAEEKAEVSTPIVSTEGPIITADTIETLNAKELDELKELCMHNLIDYNIYVGKNTKKKLASLIWEKQNGMPSTINLLEEAKIGAMANEAVVYHPEILKEENARAGSIMDEIKAIGEPAPDGKRSFSAMKNLYTVLEDNLFTSDRIAMGIKACDLQYKTKEELCRMAPIAHLEQIINNC